jgi:hypothetical protein
MEFNTKFLETDVDVRAFFNSIDYKQRITALQLDLQQVISDVQVSRHLADIDHTD